MFHFIPQFSYISTIYFLFNQSHFNYYLLLCSATPSARYPQKHGACHDRRACTPHNTPVLYAPAGHEVRAGQRLSIPDRQLSLYEWLPIR